MNTTGTFHYIDLSSISPPTRPWNKVDIGATSYGLTAWSRPVTDLRSQPPSRFTLDSAGFAVLRSPTTLPASSFLSPNNDPIRTTYYAEVSALLRAHAARVRDVVIFDHTVRRRAPDAARAPVTQVHVDQTPAAAAARVRRHVVGGGGRRAEEYLRPGRRFQLINVWRAIGHAASDMPLAVVDWRSTAPADFVPVDLLYPRRQRPGGKKRADSAVGGVAREEDDDDDRGKEERPDESTWGSTEGYEVRGETMAVAPSESHRFYYAKDLAPDEVLLLKCYDSWGEGEPDGGREGIAVRTPHTAFVDPATPVDAPPRQSVEVRCLVFYDDE